MNNVLIHPLVRPVLWMMFAIMFYYSGLSFTTWLLEPDNLTGVMDGLGAALFPVLLPTFFVVNRRLGCASGRCASGECKTPKGSGYPPDRMPGI